MQTNEFNDLIRRISYDKDAFDKLYSYFFARIVLHLNIRFGGKVNGEDIAQDFFLKLIKMQDIPTVEYPTAWVYRICDNLALDKIKSQHQQIDIEQTVLVAEIGESIEEKELLRKVLSQLPQKTREIIILKVIEGYSFVEIAVHTNTSVNTIKSLHRRGLLQAQKLYKMYSK